MKGFHTKNIAKEYLPDGYVEVIDFFFNKDKIGYAMIRNRNGNIFIELLGVYPEFRDKGYGRKIVEYLHRKIKLLKSKEVYLVPRDSKAESFWKHFGYEQYHESNYLKKIL